VRINAACNVLGKHLNPDRSEKHLCLNKPGEVAEAKSGFMFDSILCQVTEYDPDVLESLIQLAVEIAREGREGRRVGTLFTLGDEQAVLEKSRSLILDPLAGHPLHLRQLSNPNLWGTVKELSQLDGGFVVSHDGVVLSACRYMDALGAKIEIPLGLGSRHIAAANMSAATNAVGIVVSESSVVRLFCHGKLVGEIIPELWMADRAALQGAVKKETFGQLTVLTPSTRGAPTAK
jgi:diadenylate cyclase